MDAARKVASFFFLSLRRLCNRRFNMRLPAEWEKQSGIQLTWPHSDTEWFELEKVKECYVDIARNILRFEPLMMVCRDMV